MPLLEPSNTGFTIAGKGKVAGSASPGAHHNAFGHGDGAGDEAPGDAFVERRSQGEGIGARIGQAKVLADRGNHGFPSPSAQALRQVEDEIRRLFQQPGNKARVVLEREGVHAAPCKGRRDGLGHRGQIELLEAIVDVDDGILGKAAIDDGCAESHDPWITRRSRAARRVRGARGAGFGAGSGRAAADTAAAAPAGSCSFCNASRRS